MTQYQFTVNGQTDTGSLTWNKDGTLASLGIADDISGSSDTQNCSYTHDDLGRLSGVSCGSLWQQTFSLDAFGNLRKSGNSNWQPLYSVATNQANISYDGDGNVTGDGTYAYTRDAAGELASVDGSAAVYDALGRRVETGGNAEWAYAPEGGAALVALQAQTLGWARAALPGGAWAVYSGSGLEFYRHGDWLGTDRLASELNHAIWSVEAYAPYGDAYAATNQDWMFTGHDANYTRSATGSLYDFPFREYQPTQGRWLSPDPAGLAAVNPSSPQTWNAYAYVANQPLEFTDPLGLQAQESCVQIGGLPFRTISTNAWGHYWGGAGGIGEDAGLPLKLAPGLDSPHPGISVDGLPGQIAVRVIHTTWTVSSRLECAAAYGQNHSIASWFGAQNTWWGRALGGNIVSTAVEAGFALFSRGAPAAGLVASRYGGQAVVVGAGGALGGVVTGAGPEAGAISGLTAGCVATTGAGPGLISLGITSSGQIAEQGSADLVAQAVGPAARWGTGLAAAKAVFDLGTFFYGYFAACSQ